MISVGPLLERFRIRQSLIGRIVRKGGKRCLLGRKWCGWDDDLSRRGRRSCLGGMEGVLGTGILLLVVHPVCPDRSRMIPFLLVREVDSHIMVQKSLEVVYQDLLD